MVQLNNAFQARQPPAFDGIGGPRMLPSGADLHGLSRHKVERTYKTFDSKKFETVVADKQLRNQNSQAATSWGFRSSIRFARTFREIRAVTGPADPDVPETAATASSPTKLRRLLRTGL